MLGAGTTAMIVFYLVSFRRAPDGSPRGLRDLLAALSIGAGLCLSNAGEVLIGLVSRGSEFVRTPKRGAAGRATYRAQPRAGVALIELLFALYHGAGVVYAVSAALWGALPFLLLFVAGFAVASGSTAGELWSSAEPAFAREGAIRAP